MTAGGGRPRLLGQPAALHRRRLHDHTDGGETDKQNCRPRLRQYDRLLNQMRSDHRGENDQRPVKKSEQEERANNSADEKSDAGITRVRDKECRRDRQRQFSTGEKARDGDCNFLQENREERADKSEADGKCQRQPG